MTFEFSERERERENYITDHITDRCNFICFRRGKYFKPPVCNKGFMIRGFERVLLHRVHSHETSIYRAAYFIIVTTELTRK